jgi:hypothetical protein
MKHFQYSCVFLFVAWFASASGEAKTGAESQVTTQIPMDEIRLETIASQLSWVIGNDEVEVAVMRLGADVCLDHGQTGQRCNQLGVFENRGAPMTKQ